MPSFATLEWQRALTQARWIARIVGVAAFAGWVALVIGFLVGEHESPSGTLVAAWALVSVGLVAAIAWKGIGELTGGVIIIGGVVADFVFMRFQPLLLLFTVPIALAGVLFIVCGWYAMTRQRPPSHTTA